MALATVVAFFPLVVLVGSFTPELMRTFRTVVYYTTALIVSLNLAVIDLSRTTTQNRARSHA